MQNVTGETNLVTKLNKMDFFNSFGCGCSLELLPWLKDIMSKSASAQYDDVLNLETRYGSVFL